MFFIISLFFSVSCSVQQEEIFDVEFSSDYTLDLTGFSFTWASNWAEQTWKPYPGFSSDGDRMLKRYSDLEKEYGCEFDVVHWEDGSSQIIQRIAAGIRTPDWMDTHSRVGGISLFKANLLVSLEDIPTVNFESGKYGTKEFVRYGTYEGKIYGFTPYLWDYGPEFLGVCAFNATMLSELGITSPYELQEKGEWNWENFKQMLWDIKEAEGGAVDGFSPLMIREIWETVCGLWFSNDLQIVDITSNKGSIGVNNSNGYAAVEYLKELFDSELCTLGEARNFSLDELCAIQFNQANLVAAYMNEASSGFASEADFAYGVMSYPYGPNGTEKSHSAYVSKGRRLNYVIGFSGNSIEDIGHVLEYIYEPLDGSVGWKEYLSDNLFWDERDGVNYNYMIDNIYYDYSIELDTVYDSLSSEITKAVNGSITPASAFDALDSNLSAVIAENIDPYINN